MRRFAIAIGVLATLMGTSVHAADVPVKVPQPLPQVAWNWSGFYVGLGGSLKWADFNQSLQGVSGGHQRHARAIAGRSRAGRRSLL